MESTTITGGGRKEDCRFELHAGFGRRCTFRLWSTFDSNDEVVGIGDRHNDKGKLKGGFVFYVFCKPNKS